MRFVHCKFREVFALAELGSSCLWMTVWPETPLALSPFRRFKTARKLQVALFHLVGFQSFDFAFEQPAHTTPGHVNRCNRRASRLRRVADGHLLQHMKIEKLELPRADLSFDSSCGSDNEEADEARCARAEQTPLSVRRKQEAYEVKTRFRTISPIIRAASS
jgi:hypothetical protein